MGMLTFAAAACLTLGQAADATTDAVADRAPFVQDRFYIGFYGDPPAGEDLDARYREIADAHFTVTIIGSLRGANPEEQRARLDPCDALGLAAIVVHTDPTPEGAIDGRACVGYAVRDEPNAKAFPRLAEVTRAFEREKPGKPALINLFPSYASPWGQLGAATYEEYVAQFVDIVQPQVLCMDHYPKFRPGEPDGRDAYCADLDVMRRHALRADIPFWNFFNVMPYGPHTDPTEDQLRWQIFASLTYGAKGVLYFCYWTPTHRALDGSFEFPKGGAIITADGRRTRHYAQASRLNFAVKNLGPTLMALTSTAVVRVEGDADQAALAASTPIRAITKAEIDPPHDYLVGAFDHADGRRAVMLMNYRSAYTAWPTVAFDCDPAEVREVCQETGAEIPVIDDSPEMDGLQLSLDAGQGRLFLLPAK